MSFIGKWLGDVADDVGDGVKFIVGSGKDIVEHTEDTFSSIVSLPLLILGVGVAVFLMRSNAGQVAEASGNIAKIYSTAQM